RDGRGPPRRRRLSAYIPRTVGGGGTTPHPRVWKSPLLALVAGARLDRHSRSFLVLLGGAGPMPDMTAEDLKEHLKLIQAATTEDLDELLHDLLVRVYPSKKTQDS